ncbi:DNA-directed RNA polymerase subunit K [Methanococcus voltae]|uniref:DNA-directed RNA polymerase subunit K n=1 Tax=Methanococcus voltae TaxID=2188 RepID=UPI001AE763BA|nr:DNA-directed RNA polymerase subunit K [Methanococcus voltae]MBP2172648.1 DNA-directed RNA polymerase subunit K [Methanococcus voltae]
MSYTKFEKARLIGSRALQISGGAPTTVDSESSSSLDLAIEEVNKEVVPLTIKKPKVIKLDE